MPFQIILVTESDPISKTDYMYINSILNEVYHIRLRNDKISSVFMGGKGNYKKNRVVKKIKDYIKQYEYIGNSYVVYCFDTDKYNTKPDDKLALREKEQYCIENDYYFVWFCHDIEEVFLGKSVRKNEKTDKAKQYIINSKVKNLNLSKLKSANFAKGKSNLLLILDEIFEDR